MAGKRGRRSIGGFLGDIFQPSTARIPIPTYKGNIELITDVTGIIEIIEQGTGNIVLVEIPTGTLILDLTP